MASSGANVVATRARAATTRRAKTAEERRWEEICTSLTRGTLDERMSLLESVVASEPALDGDALFELTQPLVEALQAAERASEVAGMLDRLREQRPAEYEEEAAWFELARAESAVLCHASSLGDALDRFACHAAKHAEQTARLVDRLLWHGDAAALLRLLEAIWPAYRDDEGILDWAKDDLSSLARTLLVDRHIDAGGLAADPMLRGRVERFSSDSGDAATFIALADPKSARRWSLEELQRSSEANGALLVAFRRRLRASSGWSLARAALAEREMYLGLRRNWGREGSTSAASLLMPGADALVRWAARYFQGLFALGAGYACGAYLEALPAWADMLAEAELVDPVVARREVRTALGRCAPLVREIAFDTSDPALRREVERIVGQSSEPSVETNAVAIAASSTVV